MEVVLQGLIALPAVPRVQGGGDSFTSAGLASL